MPHGWAREWWAALAAAVTLYVAAQATDTAPSLWWLGGALAYIAWHGYFLLRLVRWLTHERKQHPPDPPGLWGEAFYQLYKLQQRHRKRKEKLAEMLGRYRESTAALPDATVVLDRKNAIEWWNEAAGTMLGLRNPEDLEQRIDNLIRHPRFGSFLSTGDFTHDVVLPSPCHDDLVIAIRIIPYAQGKRRLLVARDVTYVERLEEIRRDFVANVSHELRTPLTVITGFLETLQDADDEATRAWQRPLAQMRQQAQRMRRIVEDLLLLAKLESDSAPQTKPGFVDMGALLTAIRDDAVALSGERGHRIQLEVESGLLLQGHDNEWRSALSNLVFNAVQYTPAGGAITLRWYAHAEGAHLEVQDTGVGIAPQHLPRLTERFYRVDVSRSRAQGGTGLGLAIVKHVLQRHDAQLRIDSELGKGSVFRCHFPTARLRYLPTTQQAVG